MRHQYLIEQPSGERVPCNEWHYLDAMATGSYEHVICTASVTVFRKWRH